VKLPVEICERVRMLPEHPGPLAEILEHRHALHTVHHHVWATHCVHGGHWVLPLPGESHHLGFELGRFGRISVAAQDLSIPEVKHIGVAARGEPGTGPDVETGAGHPLGRPL
jgi:hypothetical protein